jgi:pilus assembly protein Flp/PilA
LASVSGKKSRPDVRGAAVLASQRDAENHRDAFVIKFNGQILFVGPRLVVHVKRPATSFDKARPVSVSLISDGRTRPNGRGITMKELMRSIERFLVSEDGPTAVEYAVMLALIVVVCLGAIQAVGTNANTTFTNVSQAI